MPALVHAPVDPAIPADLHDAGGCCSRRCFLSGSVGAAIAAVLTVPAARTAPAAAAGSGLGPMVLIEDFWNDGTSRYQAEVPRVIKTDAQWRALLSPLAFEVTRRGATEPAYSGAYLHNRAQGVYRCVCCDTALFNSDAKFDAGDGWPGFRQVIARDNVDETLQAGVDPGANRLAVNCQRCDAHLGEVGADASLPSGLRYSINSVALHFARSL